MNRESFIFYRSFMEALNELNDKQYARVFRAITKFALDGEEIELAGIEKVIFSLIKPQLVANQKRYENGCKHKRNGSETEAQQEQTISKSQPNVNVNDNVNVFKVSKKESKEIDFKNNNTQARESYEEIMEEFGVSSRLKPTLWEFIQHCLANGHVLTNSKLEDIIIELDKSEDESAKITMLKRAISGGYYDVLRLNS